MINKTDIFIFRKTEKKKGVLHIFLKYLQEGKTIFKAKIFKYFTNCFLCENIRNIKLSVRKTDFFLL